MKTTKERPAFLKPLRSISPTTFSAIKNVLSMWCGNATVVHHSCQHRPKRALEQWRTNFLLKQGKGG